MGKGNFFKKNIKKRKKERKDRSIKQRILEQNTEAINDLKVQIATLSQSLKSITESGGTQ